MAFSLLLSILLPVLFPGNAFSAEAPKVEIDSLIGRVGREGVLLSDIQRFAEVDKILLCAGIKKRDKPLPIERKALLSSYIEEELMYLEARAKKVSTAGQVPLSVQAILAKEACRSTWLSLGERYAKLYRTDTRAREGEGLLVRELEKRVLVESFRRKEIMLDVELWKREASVRYPVKVYLE
jgi:hypothetical protein